MLLGSDALQVVSHRGPFRNAVFLVLSGMDASGGDEELAETASSMVERLYRHDQGAIAAENGGVVSERRNACRILFRSPEILRVVCRGDTADARVDSLIDAHPRLKALRRGQWRRSRGRSTGRRCTVLTQGRLGPYEQLASSLSSYRLVAVPVHEMPGGPAIGRARGRQPDQDSGGTDSGGDRRRDHRRRASDRRRLSALVCGDRDGGVPWPGDGQAMTATLWRRVRKSRFRMR
jgi:hypothetical protein